jgi:hypothetical protein
VVGCGVVIEHGGTAGVHKEIGRYTCDDTTGDRARARDVGVALPVAESGATRVALVACSGAGTVAVARPATRAAEVAATTGAVAAGVAVEDVAIRRLTVDQAVARTRGSPPPTDKMTGRAVVDTAMQRAAKCGVAVVTARGGPTYSGIGRHWTEQEINRCNDQRGRRHRHFGEKVASAWVVSGPSLPHRPVYEAGHAEYVPLSRAASPMVSQAR